MMPPIAIPATAKLVLGAIGAAAVIHWVVKEVRRINEELDRLKAAPVIEPVAREALPTLRRDPHSGEWRLM
jgi:hypothetical protein